MVRRYGKLEDLENAFTQGRDNYPKTVQDAYSLLTNWKDKDSRRTPGPTNDGVSFTNVNSVDIDEIVLNTNGGDSKKKGKKVKDQNGFPGITCHKCGNMGHYASDCAQDHDIRQTGTQMLMSGVASGEFDDQEDLKFSFYSDASQMSVLLNQPTGHVPRDWILLDNQSTVGMFYNKKLLRNIRQADSHMYIHCNAGVTSTNLIGDLPGYGPVWYHPNGIANILSLARMKDRHRVTFDSDNGNRFTIHKKDGSTRDFRESKKRLYYIDTSAEAVALTINTVDDNKSRYTNRDYSRALLARKIQGTIGCPRTRSYLHIIDNNLLPNCPVTREDVLAAEDILGPNLGSLKGKTSRSGTSHVRDTPTTPSIQIMSRYKDVTVAGDIMYVNKIPFFMSVWRHIKFGRAEMITSETATTLLVAIKQVKRAYAQRGFAFQTMLLDGQFKPLRADLAGIGITMNRVARDEHVPEIERYIRTTKERTRCIYTMLPFKRIPPVRITIEMVYASVFWLNMFPPTDGVSKTHSPRNIICGHKLDYATHCTLEFGTYIQVHEQHDNSTATRRTTRAIALRPTGNTQGGYYFFSLSTGRQLNCNHWTTLPMPAEVIERYLKSV
jgi:hypothetical protein